MPRRSKARVMRAHRSRLPSRHESSRTATYTADQVDMADKSTPNANRSTLQEDATNVADRRQQSEKNAKAWKEHIYNRIVQPVRDMGSFMTEFVHSEEPIPDCPDACFMAHVPTGEGKGHEMHVPLVDGLTSLVREFDDKERPEFFNHAHKVMQFPFALCAEEQHVTKPDVVATIPGLEYIHPLPRWRHVALVFEARPCNSDDPMKTYTKAHEEPLIQLAKSARNIMLAQGRLYAFVVGIYGTKARIFRFDRAGAVCSPLFNYIRQPQILHEFLWRFMHPPTKGCVVLGDDPTSSMGTHEDREQAQKLAEKHDPSYTYTAENPKAVRRLIVTNEAGREIHYLAYKLIFVNPRLFSRATVVWEAFELGDEDPETGRREGTGKRVVIKEAWRQFARPSEIRFYRAMREAMEEAEEGVGLSLNGIAEFECGDDLGLREARRLEEMAGPEPKANIRQGAVPNSTSKEPNDPDAYPPKLRVPYWQVLGHRTITARCRFTDEADESEIHEYHERGQIRTVLRTIGVPITEFEETYELVSALRDAIEGHQQAYLAGIIHRDISNGNVMIARRRDGASSGFIHDFDYALSWKRFLQSEGLPVNLESWIRYARDEYKPFWRRIRDRMIRQLAQEDKKAQGTGDPKNDTKQRTGTRHFMSIEVLTGGLTHEARHDLESFFWLLVWIVLRHTEYVHDDEQWAWHRLFDSDDCQVTKERWLSSKYPPVMMVGNDPLDELLEGFRSLCATNHNSDDLKKESMTHEDVLAIFNRALEDRDAWPKGDRAKPWSPPKTDMLLVVPGMEEPPGQLRSKGTLTYTSEGATFKSHARRRRRRPEDELVDSGSEHSGSEHSGSGHSGSGHSGSAHTATDSDAGMMGVGRVGRTTDLSVVRRRQNRHRAAVQRASTSMTHAFGRQELPPSTESESAQTHPSGYALRSAKCRQPDELRPSVRSTSRNMRPPPMLRTRSGASQSQSSRQAAPRSGAASKCGSSATKRSRTREETENDVGASSSKRVRTLSQPEPRNTKESRKSKSKR